MRVFLIGVGGATCSGKTTLAKHLRTCIPNSFIIHQDDFAPPQELVPMHPVYNVQDWDDAPGAIDWPRMRSALAHVQKTGKLPGEHYSHDHLNEQVPVPVNGTALGRVKEAVRQVEDLYPGEETVWAIVDGFLLYWDQEIVSQLDVRILLRVPEPTLKKRRHERHGYHTAVQSDPEGALWRDPPNYWEQIVYPAYARAHEGLFEGGDVETGALKPKEKNEIVLLDGEKLSMDSLVEATAQEIGKRLGTKTE